MRLESMCVSRNNGRAHSCRVDILPAAAIPIIGQAVTVLGTLPERAYWTKVQFAVERAADDDAKARSREQAEPVCQRCEARLRFRRVSPLFM